MTEKIKLYTEDDVEELLKNRRLLAAAHAYSMDRLPLGGAIVRAGDGTPSVPRHLNTVGRGYEQLIHDLAERIVGGQIKMPENVFYEFPDIYSAYDWSKPYVGTRARKFSELRDPEEQKKAFGLYRNVFNDDDLNKLTSDEKILACIDAYRKNLITFGAAKTHMYGDPNYSPFGLSWRAFHELCVAVIQKMNEGTIKIPSDLQQRFPHLYVVSEVSSEKWRAPSRAGEMEMTQYARQTALGHEYRGT